MRKYKTIKQAVESLAIGHEKKPMHMIMESVKDPLFRKPMQDSHYSHNWLRHQLYVEKNLIVFKKLLKIFPTDHDFTIEGVEGEFLVEGE